MLSSPIHLTTLLPKTPILYGLSSYMSGRTLTPSDIDNPLQFVSQDYNLYALITHPICVDFIHEWRGTTVWRRAIDVRNFSWYFDLFSEFLPENCWEKVAERNIFLISRIICWGLNTGSLDLLIKTLLGYGDCFIDVRLVISMTPELWFRR